MKRAAIAIALLALGCGPSLKELLPQKHYREAVCYAHDGGASDRGSVLRALTADAEVTLHVHALTRDELLGVLGDATEPIASRATLARVRVQTNALPVDGLDVVAAVAADGAMAEPVSWDSLARVTNERLPPHQTEKSYATVGNAVAVLTLGLSLLFGVGGDSRNVEVEAPHAEYARMAPRATALHDALGRARCSGVSSSSGVVGRQCEGFFIIDATKNAPVRLEVAVRYVALREGGKLDDLPTDALKKRCELTSKSVVQLGQANQLASTTLAMFGPGPRRLADVAQ